MKTSINHLFSDFLQKMRFKYRISIMNENTLEESWYTRLSRFNVLLFVTAFFLLTFIVLTIIIFITPLRFYLPGYQDSGNRMTIIHQSLQIDSINRELVIRDAYLLALKENLEDTAREENNAVFDSANLRERATELMEKSKREKDYIARYEETEKYNLGATSSKRDEKMYVFFRPVNGVVASTFKPREGEFGLSIITGPQETVKSIQKGRVFFTSFTFDNMWVIQIIHENGYISIYKNNKRLLKQVGETVVAGEGIAVTGASDDKEMMKHFYFELWKDGNSINPQDLITFRF